ncbi:unnamed protein product [Arabidopsis halleri]
MPLIFNSSVAKKYNLFTILPLSFLLNLWLLLRQIYLVRQTI